MKIEEPGKLRTLLVLHSSLINFGYWDYIIFWYSCASIVLIESFVKGADRCRHCSKTLDNSEKGP